MSRHAARSEPSQAAIDQQIRVNRAFSIAIEAESIGVVERREIHLLCTTRIRTIEKRAMMSGVWHAIKATSACIAIGQDDESS